MKCKKTYYECDECGEVSESDDSSYGGRTAGSGWFSLERRRSDCFSMPQDVDLCSTKCLKKYIDDKYPEK
jgi:hypothetical protein